MASGKRGTGSTEGGSGSVAEQVAPSSLSCASCRFFGFSGANSVCRLNPPQTAVSGAYRYAVWPPVTAQDWCGKYEAK